MKKKNMKTAAIATALVGVLCIGGIMAYFTDTGSATNTFTYGTGIDIEVEEPGWDPEEGKNIVPNEEITKDPKITNSGSNDAFVFMTATVPYANVITANEDGTKNPAADTELFSYDINAGWVEIGTATKDEAAKTITHTYVYGTADACTALGKDAETPALFNSVKAANVVEGQNLEGTTVDLLMNGFAIQAEALENGATAPTDVWGILQSQMAAQN